MTNKMRNFEVSFEVLKRVINDNVPFHLALKNTLKKERNKADKDFALSISSTCGCVLRHTYLFQELIERKYPNLENDKGILVSIGLANHLFSKRIDEKDLNKYLAKETGLNDVQEFIESLSDPKTLIPEDIAPDSKKFYSLRYNLPLWVVSMWEKNLGPFISKKLFRSLNYKNGQLLVVNKNEISSEELLKKYSEFVPFEEGVVLYEGKDNVKKHPAVMSGELLNISGAYDLLFKKLDLDVARGIACYSASSCDALAELYVLLGNSLKMDYLCGSQKHFFETREFINRFSLKSVSLFESSHNEIETCISKPVHTFFLCPRNTYFKGFIESPDYYLHIKQEDLDEIIKQEKEALLESSKQVEEDGYLVYMLPTVCKNETKTVIHSFLSEHKDFVLVEEKQLLPFDKYRSMFYYAILKREVNHD